MSEEVINNLKKLQAIKMSAAEQTRQRDFILQQISQSQNENLSSWKMFWHFFNQPFVFKPLAYVTAVLLILLAGTSYTFSAATHSLPGNTFYPVKLSWEKLQVSLASSEVNKTKKQIEFADRRLSEIGSLSEEASSPVDKQEKVAQAVKYFNESIQEAKSSLEKAAGNETEQNGELLEVAQLVNDKSADFADTLVGYYPDLPVTVKSVVEKEVDDIKFQSLELLISRYNQSNDSVSHDAIFEQLQDRLIVLGEWASEVEDEETKAEALARLVDLQELLEQDEFSQVVDGINDFSSWQERLQTPDTSGEVLGVSENLDINVVTTTPTSTDVTTE